MMMLANVVVATIANVVMATKLTVTVGVFLIDTRMPVMIKLYRVVSVI